MQSTAKYPSIETVPIVKILFMATLFYIAWFGRDLIMVLNYGTLKGHDDYLRLYQVLSWMNGQNWNDLTAYRMLPPDGTDIHWTRIVDVPIAGYIKLFSYVADLNFAIKLTAIFWPLSLFLAAIFLLVTICDYLIPNYNRYYVLLFAVFCASTLVEFAPGRIDHHNAQIILLLAVVLGILMQHSLLSSFLIGLSIPLSFSIGLDAAILFIPLLIYIGVEWACGKKRAKDRIILVGAVMGVSSVMLYGLLYSPLQWNNMQCDVYSLYYLSALVLVSVGFVGLGAFTNQIDRFDRSPVLARLIIGSLVGCVGLAILSYGFTQCGAGPLSGLSKTAQEVWLNQVMEAVSLGEYISDFQHGWIKYAAFLAVTLFTATIVLQKRFSTTPQWLALYFTLLACFIGTLFQVSMFKTGLFLTVPFCTMFATMTAKWLTEKVNIRQGFAIAGQGLVCVLISSFFWEATAGLVPEPPKHRFTEMHSSNQPIIRTSFQKNPGHRSCYRTQDFDNLNFLQSGLVMSDLSYATSLLVNTSHNVITGPYHRNEEAVVDTINFFRGTKSEAQRIAEKYKIDYVSMCVVGKETKLRSEKNTLRSEIFRGKAPDWLEWVSDKNANVRVLRVKKLIALF